MMFTPFSLRPDIGVSSESSTPFLSERFAMARLSHRVTILIICFLVIRVMATEGKRCQSTIKGGGLL